MKWKRAEVRRNLSLEGDQDLRLMGLALPETHLTSILSPLKGGEEALGGFRAFLLRPLGGRRTG
jgi:hypothetical protein